MSSSSVTSASSKFVSCGIVVYDWIMLRAIVCRMRDIFSIAHAAEVVGVGAAGRRDAARLRGGDLLVGFADVGADVFGRDAAAGAGGADAAEIDAQLPGQAAHGGTGRGRGVAIAGHVVDGFAVGAASSDLVFGRFRRGVRFVVVGFSSRFGFFAAGLAGFFFFLGVVAALDIGFLGALFDFFLRGSSGSGSLSFFAGALAFSSLGGSDFFLAGFSSSPSAASISMIGAPISIVSPSVTRILVILPASGLGIGIVALSVSTSSRS